MHLCDKLFVNAGKFNVKRNQTGKVYKVKIDSLSKEDEEPIQKQDLVEGTQRLLTYENKDYPVTFQSVVQNRK